MGWVFLGKFGIMWVLIVLILVSGHSDGCLEGERRGLLEFKDFLKSNGADADHLHPTWVDEKADHHSDCCDWERVTCDRTTGHITELSLDNIEDTSYQHYRMWFINASLFLPFKELRSLNLSFNSFSGWTHNEGFERLSNLRKLEIVDLGSNNFDDNNVFHSLGALTSIKTLIISNNALGGYFPAHELVALRNLKTLDIGFNHYYGCLPMQGFEKLSALRKLETLNLEWNEFDHSILPSMSALRSLKMLNLHANNIGGLFPPQELAYLGNLERLDLSFIQFNDIQGCENLSRLENLETLYLRGNRFNKSVILCLSSLISLKNLSLQGNNLGDPFPARELTVLKNLETLDLSSNELSSLTMQDSKLLSNLSKMRHLDLSGNHFDKDAFRILGALPSLKFLSLLFNQMEGPLSNQELTYNLSNLEVLLLRGNLLNGTLPMEGLTSFRHLQILDLSENNFFASIPPSIGALSSLKALSLAQNNLSGSLPIQGLCKLKKLEELDLSHNHFEGILPSCLSNLRSLKFFDISLNQFTGNISPSLFGSLNSLEYIDLSHNCFEGLFSFGSFANHSNLEVFELISDNDKFEVETESTDWIPMFQLKVLVLSNCKLSGKVPKFLLYENKLKVIDLSHNNLTGSFTNWLWVNNTGLEVLNLRNNSFVGQFCLPSHRYINTYWMDISNNRLSGQIQANMGHIFPYIFYINLSRNAFEGGIPSSFGKISWLEYLDLSTNNLSGEVPNQLVRNCRALKILILSNNNFHGQIFSAAFNLTSIWRLQLNDNQFAGPLTNVLSKLSNLYFLDISNNYMFGKIPSSMDNMTSLGTLIIRNNSFNGEFPCALVPNVFMDAAYNLFSGSIHPSCSNPNLGYVEHMHLQGNKFTGLIPRALLNSSNLLTFDIRENSFSGSIPDSIGVASNLRILLFRGNQLSGSIPTQLCQLTEISLMDLSNNYLDGSIPQCFGNITFGMIGASDQAFMQTIVSWYGRHTFYHYNGVLERNFEIHDRDTMYAKADEVEFVTKSRTNFYWAGSILNFMSGLDLSCNKLTGEIPFELGKLSSVRALNLSHNLLTGPIPKAFSNLIQMESLDLSYNNLSGNIPTELINLHFLEVFIVAHNNLSGKLLDRKAQFGTFEASSYEGNPFLCGPPLEKNCTPIINLPHSPITVSSGKTERKWYDIDLVAFSASFVGSYISFLFGFAIILYINPYWRQRWFYLIEEGMYSSYYFISDTLGKIF
ncbi:receptor-like protein 56 isoform X1 [Camellia sinensis]|uniref:receptor-like protein 56 isoform X1 n=1 Tax=Camellia sinensis TaxID=4442 RepID=UPI0010367007|nr:receptor-like protein 56 isoform X1 [Camellia sinensis]